MKFSEALELLQQGRRVRRRLWSGIGWNVQLELVHLDDHQGIPVAPMLMSRYQEEGSWAWRPFSGANWDLLADDWEEVQ